MPRRIEQRDVGVGQMWSYLRIGIETTLLIFGICLGVLQLVPYDETLMPKEILYVLGPPAFFGAIVVVLVVAAMTDFNPFERKVRWVTPTRKTCFLNLSDPAHIFHAVGGGQIAAGIGAITGSLFVGQIAEPFGVLLIFVGAGFLVGSKLPSRIWKERGERDLEGRNSLE